jgi:DNA polymerase-3 subunit alpha
MPEMDEDLKLSLEKEATGLYLSGHPMSKYENFMENAGFAKTLDILSGKIPDDNVLVVEIGRKKYISL